ncbi:hypothetical protein [Methylobacterium radiotolerans]
MAQPIPANLIEWERVLCARFLRVRPGGDASPILSLEITASTLAEACGLGLDQGPQVEEAFRSAFRENALLAALTHADHPRLERSQGVPGWFVYLAMTLFVDSLVEETGEGAYRAKLKWWLRSDRSFSKLEGVAIMWRRLRDWLEVRAARGEDWRRLVLPPDNGWTHIGYTRNISFPAKRDVALVGRFVAERPEALEQPLALLRTFSAVALGSRASHGLRGAFEDFRRAYMGSARALADHRFWRFVLAQAAATGRPQAGAVAVCEIRYGEDGERVYLVQNADGSRVTAPDLGSAAKALAPHPSVKAGYVPFLQMGNARWRSATELAECRGYVRLGMSDRLRGLVGDRLGKVEPTGTWWIASRSMPFALVEAVLADAGVVARPSGRVLPVSIFDGVQTNDIWLGRPAFLPRISADALDPVVHPEPGARGDVATAQDPDAPDMHLLRSEGVVGGTFMISSPVAGWSRRVTFAPDAVPHQDLSGANADLPVLDDWNAVEACAGLRTHSTPSGWAETDPHLGDLLEAVYAGGRSGWEEFDLVELIRRGMDGRVRPWSMLRCLQDGGIVRPRLRRQWRGRVWTLEPVGLHDAGDGTTVLVGALCERIQEDFRLASAALGGAPFRNPGLSPASPPVVGCVGIPPYVLSERLGWPVRPAAAVPAAVPLALSTTLRRTDGYRVGSHWDWDAGRFVFGPSPADPVGTVAVERYVHAAARDHDVFVARLADRASYHLSRSAAVVAGHVMAGRPLFEPRAGVLAVRGHDGLLPDALVRELRLRHLTNPGPAGEEYVYPLCAADLVRIRLLLPGLTLGDAISDSPPPAAVANIVRRSGGRDRFLWSEGRLSSVRNRQAFR